MKDITVEFVSSDRGGENALSLWDLTEFNENLHQ
jgi:hypothetical protein